MKKLISLALAWFAIAFSAFGAESKTSFGLHGMALFGSRDALYASHLPMFHAPHDYQVVLQVHLADPAQDKMLREQLDGKAVLWTLAPEKFELNRLAPGSSAPLKQFKADLVLGHFEQGGTTQIAGATVVIDKVLVFRHLSPKVKKNDTAKYLQIGSGERRFLIKEIDSRPDFDHIVAIETQANASTKAIKVNKVEAKETAGQAFIDALQPDTVRIIGSVYFCSDDLL